MDFKSAFKKKKMKNPCWKGYVAYGMKKKGGKKVPNCVPKGKLTKENIRRIRPGYGLEPIHYEKMLGKKASKNLSAGTPLNLIYAKK